VTDLTVHLTSGLVNHHLSTLVLVLSNSYHSHAAALLPPVALQLPRLKHAHVLPPLFNHYHTHAPQAQTYTYLLTTNCLFTLPSPHLTGFFDPTETDAKGENILWIGAFSS
jgi:hypothetical protein